MILEIKDLSVEFDTEQGRIRALDQVGFELKKGTTLGIAGESGCGKSVTALSIMRLLPQPMSRIVQGEAVFGDQDIFSLPVEKLHHIRGRKIAMIFQEPMTALNPVHGIGKQIREVYQLHFPGMATSAMEKEAVSVLDQVGIPDPDRVMRYYPHQLSGGMRQRVMIAMALACRPDILIADEPTTALDVTVQAQILSLINSLKKQYGMSVVLITHDLGVIAENCDDVVVMYAGRVAERAPVKALFRAAQHPYTQGLLKSIPSLAKAPKTVLPTIAGNVPSLLDMPSGCRFADRCEWVGEICRKQIPREEEVAQGHFAACHFASEVKNRKF